MIRKLNRFIYNGIKIIGVLSMIWIFFTLIATPTLSSIGSDWRYNSILGKVVSQNILALLCSSLAILGVFLINKKVIINKKIGLTIVLFGSLIYFLILIYQYRFLNIVVPIDDTAIVMAAAKEFIQTGSVTGWYMSANPQNLMVMFVYVFIFKVSNSYGIFNVYVFFSLLQVLTAILIYLVTAMKKKYLISVVAAIFFMLTIQINLHVLFMYTDILSFVPLLLTLLFLTKYSEEKNKNRVFYLGLASLFASLTFLTKGLYLIFIIAIIITVMLFSPKGQKKFVLIPIIIFIASNLIWNNFISKSDILPIEDYGMPNTHYVFMGMNTDYYLVDERREYRLAGGYSDNDLLFSKQLFWDEKLDKSEISSIHFSKVIERINGKTYSELLRFFNAKVSSTWSSGDLKSTMSLKLATNKSVLSQKLANSKALNFYMQTIQGMYYIIFLIYFVKSFKTKRDNELYFISGLFMVGMFMFIFIWESSPRYAMTVMPAALILFPYVFDNDKVKIKMGNRH